MYEIFDMHNDYFLKLNTDTKRNCYINKTKPYAKGILSAIWTSELNESEAFSALTRARDYVNTQKNTLLSVEDLHFLSKNNLNQFLDIMPICAGLVWNRTNCIAGGAFESGRLTNFGKQTIKALEKSNIIVDTAHLNEESFCDVTKIATKPIICSHTAFYGKNPHKRNLKDYQIKEIISGGGIVGLCFVSEFLNGTNKSTADDVVSQIDYFACKFGINNLALGTDFYGTKYLPEKLKSYKNITSLLAEKLLKLGYTQKAINKIFFENANNFFF